MANSDLQRQYFEMLMESQYWSPTALEAHQRTQLGHLLRHARAQSPFYAHRLDAVFWPNGEIDFDRWGEIPILKRSDLIAHREAMLARQLPPGHSGTSDAVTSGSTGQPLTVTLSALANLTTKAAAWRMHRWHGVDWSRDMVSFMSHKAASAWPAGASSGRWGPGWDGASVGELLNIHRATPPDRMLEFIGRRGAGYLTGRPKSLQSLALHALAQGGSLPLEGMLCFGTAVAEDERADCLAAFGAPMWSHYSSKEMGPIAHQCPTGTHLHVNAEMVLVEILDEHGQPAAPGEMGRVVSTAFYSTAQPLIRYEQGDLAVAGAPCTCGRSLPTLQRVVGRTTNLFRFPDGAKVAPSIPDLHRALLGAQYWQIAQIGPLALEVRYVPFPGTVPDEAGFAELVLDHIHRRDVGISFSRREALERAEGGKFVQYLCELPSEDPAEPSRAH